MLYDQRKPSANSSALSTAIYSILDLARQLDVSLDRSAAGVSTKSSRSYETNHLGIAMSKNGSRFSLQLSQTGMKTKYGTALHAKLGMLVGVVEIHKLPFKVGIAPTYSVPHPSGQQSTLCFGTRQQSGEMSRTPACGYPLDGERLPSGVQPFP